MVYLATFTIKIKHSWIGKYTIVPWIRHGEYQTKWGNTQVNDLKGVHVSCTIPETNR